MSRKIDITSLTDTQLHTMSKDLLIPQEVSKYAFNSKPKYINLLELDDTSQAIFAPFAYAKNYPRPERECFTQTNVVFEGSLRPSQKEVKTEAIKRLNTMGSVVVAAYPGYGKTITSIYMATKLKMKTLILCHRIVLINQWKESILRFCPTANVCILTSKAGTNSKATPAKATPANAVSHDFYIINAANVPKLGRDFYKDIGVVIVDEAHIIMAEKLSECMKYLLPRYLIGLSATPYRMDGLDALLDAYFGKFKIHRKLYRKHTVYRVNTEFKPEVKLAKTGKVDWSSIIDSQCNSAERNELIIKVIQYFPDRVFLVLCKRISQANYLVERLQEEKEDVTSLIGKNQTFLKESRILIGTTGKCAVGFDHPRLNAMILASDVEQYFVQYLGRVFRREDSEPLIFDFLDDHPILMKHFRTRNAVYLEHGGTVKNFFTTFQEFTR